MQESSSLPSLMHLAEEINDDDIINRNNFNRLSLPFLFKRITRKRFESLNVKREQKIRNN